MGLKINWHGGGFTAVEMEIWKCALIKNLIRINGNSCEEAAINNIFKRFYRGKNAKNQESVGIGLYLARGMS